jgi:hypothetical protein
MLVFVTAVGVSVVDPHCTVSVQPTQLVDVKLVPVTETV